MKILLAIHGSHSQPEQMQAQRETWLHDLYGADYKFFLGRPASEDEDVVSLDMPDGPIWDAHRGYGYRTPVGQRKTEALVKYALEHGYDYVFKCDDDTYVRPEQLLTSGFEQHDYSGFAEKHYAFGHGWYRWCQGGAGYWLSRRAMEIVAANGLHLVPAEDFAVGQLLARNGIEAHHDDRYTPTVTPSREDWISIHKIGPVGMHARYQDFLDSLDLSGSAEASDASPLGASVGLVSCEAPLQPLPKEPATLSPDQRSSEHS